LIEVNLLPGGRAKTAGGPRFALPKLSGVLPAGDPWALSAGAAVVLVLLIAGWLFFGTRAQVQSLEAQVDQAVQDSVRLAEVIRRTEALQARRDSIAQRVAVIQEIDGTRYVWPHLMDEVARALPDFTWLSEMSQLSPGDLPSFRIRGRAGTVFALTTFMENLEASPFIRGVRLIESDQGVVDVGGGIQRPVYQFVIEASKREPPPELVETVPLFPADLGAEGEEN
jgi:Tfp pilus assembly protein PilN